MGESRCSYFPTHRTLLEFYNLKIKGVNRLRALQTSCAPASHRGWYLNFEIRSVAQRESNRLTRGRLEVRFLSFRLKDVTYKLGQGIQMGSFEQQKKTLTGKHMKYNIPNCESGTLYDITIHDVLRRVKLASQSTPVSGSQQHHRTIQYRPGLLGQIS